MKLLSIFVFFSAALMAQAPQGIPYQAVARNGQGQPFANLPIKVRFSILDSIATGSVVFREIHTTTTSGQGLFSVNVGLGTSVQGLFPSINWGVNAKFLKVELDTTASGNNYIDLGTQQMMSVPYALYAKRSEFTASITNHNYLNIGANSANNHIIPNGIYMIEIVACAGNGNAGQGGICYAPGQQIWINGGSGGSGMCTNYLLNVNPGDTISIQTGINGACCNNLSIYQNSSLICELKGGLDGGNSSYSSGASYGYCIPGINGGNGSLLFLSNYCLFSKTGFGLTNPNSCTIRY